MQFYLVRYIALIFHFGVNFSTSINYGEEKCCARFLPYRYQSQNCSALWPSRAYSAKETISSSVCAQSCVLRLFATSWTVACQTPLSMGFPRQKYWSGLPFPTPGDLSDPGIEPASPASPALAGRFFTTALPGKPLFSSISPKPSPKLKKPKGSF